MAGVAGYRAYDFRLRPSAALVLRIISASAVHDGCAGRVTSAGNTGIPRHPPAQSRRACLDRTLLHRSLVR